MRHPALDAILNDPLESGWTCTCGRWNAASWPRCGGCKTSRVDLERAAVQAQERGNEASR